MTKIEVLALALEFEESELVLPMPDLVAERNPISLAEISGLKVSVKGGDVAFDFGFCHNFFCVRFCVLGFLLSAGSQVPPFYGS